MAVKHQWPHENIEISNHSRFFSTVEKIWQLKVLGMVMDNLWRFHLYKTSPLDQWVTSNWALKFIEAVNR